MSFERYEYDQLDEFTFRFYSIGRNGTFELRVRLVEMVYGSYNLGFGVYDSEADELDDLAEVRNGDCQKILATVANAALRFLDEHPEARIFASGSTTSRTRLYQMGINRVLPGLNGYIVLGYFVQRTPDETGDENSQGSEGRWCAIESGITYEAFLIYKV